MATLLPKVGHTIEEAGAEFAAALEKIFVDQASFHPPALAGLPGVTRFFVADGYAADLPAHLYGSELEERFYGRNGAFVDAGEGNDELRFIGSGTAIGGKGNDIVAGLDGQYIETGEMVDAAHPELGVANEDLHLVLDGGEDNDWVFAYRGEKVVTAGGLGRDWIFNTSSEGEIWGDVANSYVKDGKRYYNKTRVDSDGSATVVIEEIIDGTSNGDNFWWSPDTTIMDAQKHDVLKFFGIPLTVGVDNGGIVLGTIGAGVVGSSIGLVQTFGTSAENNFLKLPIDTIYVDEFLPFISYSFERNAQGGYDLLVGNVMQALLHATEAILQGNSGLGTKLKDYTGVQRVKDFVLPDDHGKLVGSYFGSDLASIPKYSSKLNLVFKKTNPITAVLARLPQGAITLGLQLQYGGTPLLDQALTAAAAAVRFAKGMQWSTGADPLVLDLSGRGLATTYLDDSNVHFDLNNDFFSERTGWISGDAGFLVLDRNGNGRVDDATEMFGTFTGSGFADLASHDGNHDGIIDISDAIFTRLQVWVDGNANGVTDAGELKSLADLHIKSISLDFTQINGTTVQGTTLRAAAAYTLNDGTSRIVYEAIFPTDQTDTVYRGESGRPAWAPGLVIDAKGFGRVTPLATATARARCGARQTQRCHTVLERRRLAA